MSGARLFRSLKATPTPSAKTTRRKLLTQAATAARRLKAKIAAGEALTDADHRVLVKCGPRTLKFIGYEPKVTLQ